MLLFQHGFDADVMLCGQIAYQIRPSEGEGGEQRGRSFMEPFDRYARLPALAANQAGQSQYFLIVFMIVVGCLRVPLRRMDEELLSRPFFTSTFPKCFNILGQLAWILGIDDSHLILIGAPFCPLSGIGIFGGGCGESTRPLGSPPAHRWNVAILRGSSIRDTL